jgi:hypothetical protein
VKKVLGENLLRVMAEVERVAKAAQAQPVSTKAAKAARP